MKHARILIGFSALFLFVLLGCRPAAATDVTSKTVTGPGGSAAMDPLPAFIAELPQANAAAIRTEEADFRALLAQVLTGDADLLILVDRTLSLPAGYAPPDLVKLETVKPALVLGGNPAALQLRRVLLPELQAMNQAAKKSGVSLLISSTYRSYDYQVTVFNRAVKADGREQALRESAEPGHSQHQLGLAIDFGSITDEFATTKAGKWLFAHAGEYGFSLSFPEGMEGETGYRYECWHYRYIGRAACELQRRFFGGSQHRMLDFINRHLPELRTWVSQGSGSK
jgi:D-alanyl-D-alanine carboxypeptidase